MVGAAMEAESIPERCAWCGADVDAGDCWVARARGGEEAAFCRLEHVVPWEMRGGGGEWAAGSVELVRHRGGHQLVEAFDSSEEMRKWAAKGGPWQ